MLKSTLNWQLNMQYLQIGVDLSLGLLLIPKRSDSIEMVIIWIKMRKENKMRWCRVMIIIINLDGEDD